MLVSHEEINFCAPVHRRDGRNELIDFFNLTDSLNVTWMHATNNPEKLQEGLTGDTYMMLEADVLTKHNLPNGEPIMAHPPATESNLTLAKFLEQTLYSSKGIKLDFKTMEAVEPSLKLLLNMTNGRKIKIPIWINADILPGPCYTPSECKPVDAYRFLNLCLRYVPNFTLSIGWVTQFNPTYYYNWSSVIPMGQLLVNTTQPVTFPIRYSLIARSLDQLEWLMDLSETYTMTVWSSETDEVNPKTLAALRMDLITDRRRIYYDLPSDQMKNFLKELKTYEKKETDQLLHVIKVNWQGFAPVGCKSVLIGQSSIMFTEHGGWASTDKDNNPLNLRVTHYTKHIILRTTVLFIDENQIGISQNISFILHVPSIAKNKESFDPSSGTQAILQSNGNFSLTTPSGAVSSASVSPSNTYEIMLTDVGDGRVIFEVKALGVEGNKLNMISVHTKDPKYFYTVIGTLPQAGAVLVKKLQMTFAEAMPQSGTSCLLFNNSLLVLLLALIIIYLLSFFSTGKCATV